MDNSAQVHVIYIQKLRQYSLSSLYAFILYGVFYERTLRLLNRAVIFLPKEIQMSTLQSKSDSKNSSSENFEKKKPQDDSKSHPHKEGEERKGKEKSITMENKERKEEIETDHRSSHSKKEHDSDSARKTGQAGGQDRLHGSEYNKA